MTDTWSLDQCPATHDYITYITLIVRLRAVRTARGLKKLLCRRHESETRKAYAFRVRETMSGLQ